MLPGVLIYVLFANLFAFFFVFADEIENEVRQAGSIVIDLSEHHAAPLKVEGTAAPGAALPSLATRAKAQVRNGLLEIGTALLGLCVAWVFCRPLVTVFRAKRRAALCDPSTLAAAKSRVWATPGVMAGATFLPILIEVSLRSVAFGPGHRETALIPVEAAMLALSTLFTYLWQRHLVQNRYVRHLFTAEELATMLPRGHRLPVRRSFLAVVAIATLLPVAAVVLLFGSGVKSIGTISSLSEENRRLLFGGDTVALPSLKIEGVDVARAHGLNLDQAPVPMIAPLETIRIAIGLAFGLTIVLIYVSLIARWSAGDIAEPLEELRANMARAEVGDLAALTPATTANEIGELTLGFNTMLKGIAERGRIKELFGQYLTKEISEAILDGRVALDGARYEATVVFTDIRGFTSMSERLSPEEVFAFLNDYLGRMIEVIAARGGIIDKFLGDGILAVFGLPVPFATHADEAFGAAMDMRGALRLLNGERAAAGREPIRIGIGMHTGPVIAGNVGSSKKLQFTVIGDTVNIASRLEALNKDFGSYLLMTEATYQRLGPASRNAPFERVQGISIRGKVDKMDLYRLPTEA